MMDETSRDVIAEAIIALVNEHMQSSYDVGYTEGGSNRVADFCILIDNKIESLNADGNDAIIAVLQSLLDEVDNW